MDHSLALKQVAARAAHGLVDREVLVDLVVLAAVAGEHLLVVGPPGTAKSEAVRRVAAGLGGRYFEYLLGRFTEPSEIVGPVDLRRLRDGHVETNTSGMLPEAEIAFLDEIFQGSTAILNTLLALLNERIFVRGHTRMTCPLRLCVGASNALPTDESLAAFADRFLVRVFLEPVADPQLEDLLAAGWGLQSQPEGEKVSMASLDVLSNAARRVDIAEARTLLAQSLRLLRGAGIHLSDRRAVRAQRLIAAAAALDGRRTASERDLWPLVYVVPSPEEQRAARELLKPLLGASDSVALPAAAADASLGPLVRARRMAEAGKSLLAQRPSASDAAGLTAWRLRIEGVLREIDATFAPSALPDLLTGVRQDLGTALGERADAA
jgi:MoxR-like ATPase